MARITPLGKCMQPKFPRARSLVTAPRACCSAAASASDGVARRVFLPGGAWTFLSDDAAAPIYGSSFVLPARGSAGGASLRQRPLRSTRPPASLVPTRTPRSLGMVRIQPNPPLDIVPLGLAEVALVALPVELPEQGWVSVQPLALPPPRDDASDEPINSSNCLSIVPRGPAGLVSVVMGAAMRRRGDGAQLPPDDDAHQQQQRQQQEQQGREVYETFNTKHPRRTMKIRFTCQRCGGVTVKPVNPHAWTAGTVFARCGGCGVTHKLVDNLRLFHELAGPVYNNAGVPPVEDTGSSGSNTTPMTTGLPELPERLQLRPLPWRAPPDFPQAGSLN